MQIHKDQRPCQDVQVQKIKKLIAQSDATGKDMQHHAMLGIAIHNQDPSKLLIPADIKNPEALDTSLPGLVGPTKFVISRDLLCIFTIYRTQ